MRTRLKALRVALLYGAFGAVWVLITDWLASGGSFRLFPFELQTAKGLLYVAVTAVLVYSLIRLMVRGVEKERTWYRELFELNPEPMWVYDLKTLRFLAVNKAAVEHYGYSRSEFLGMTLADIRPREDIPALRSHLTDTESRGIRTGVWRHTLKNGRVIQAEVSAHTVEFAGREAEMVLAHDLTERLEAEDGVRAAKQFLDTVISCSPLALLTIDPEGRVLTWNGSSERIFGWKTREVLGKPLPFIPAEKRGEFDRLRHRVLAGETLTGIELTRRRKDGSVVETRLSAARLLGTNGVTAGILALVEDITHRKHSEARLESAEQRLRLILNSIRDGILALDAEGRLVGVNPAASLMLGWSEDELLGRDAHTLFHRNKEEAGGAHGPECPLCQALHEGEVRQAEEEAFILRDESLLRVEYSCSPLVGASGVAGAVVTFRDVTDRKKAEDALRESENRLRLITKVTTDLIWDFDAVSNTVWWGEGFVRLFGHKPDGSVTPVEFWEERVHPDDRERAVSGIEEAFQGTGDKWSDEYRLRRDNGEYVHVLDQGYVIRDDAGRAVRMIGGIHDLTERVRAEEALRQSEHRLRLVTTATTDVIWDFDALSNTVWWGTGFEFLFGRERGEDSVTPVEFWEERVHPDDRERAVSGIEEAFQGTGDKWSDEYRLRRDNGEYVHVLDQGYVIRDASGRAVRMIGGISDLTERVRAEEALRQSEALFREMAENIRDVFYNFDPEADRMLYMSPAYAKMWGRSVESLYADPHSQVAAVHPEDREAVLADLQRQKEGEATDREYRILRPDGQMRWVRERAYPIRDSGGKVNRIVGVIRNITDRKLARDALRESEASLRLLTRQLEAEKERLEAAQAVAKVGSWDTDLATLEVIWSAETYRIFGVDPDVFRPTHAGFLALVHPDDREVVDAAFKQSAARADPNMIVHRIVLPGGSIRSIEEHWRIVRDESGRPVRASGTCQDITDRLRLEEQFRQSQKMEAIGQLAGGVAHDFNNMLTVILVRTEQALRRAEPGSPLHDGLQEILAAGERSAALTRQLLTYARRQAVQPRVLDLNAAIKGTLGMLRRLIGENIELAWLPGESLWPVRMDPVQIDQLLANLCVNARDAIDDVGKVVIETGNVAFDREYCNHHPGYKPGFYVVLTVTDNGSGMDKETMSHLFEPFFTTKELGRGTGLGLATVYGIAQQNGGFINVYSEPGSGTTFKIYLARHAAVKEDAPESRDAKQTLARGETVLLVEDEAMILDVTAEMLEDLGYAVIKAPTPAEALRLAATAEGRADLLLTDMVMPGMNGRDLAQRVRELQPGIRCVFMSGYTASVMTQRAMVDDSTPFLQKPFSTVDLAAKLRIAFDRDREAAGPAS